MTRRWGILGTGGIAATMAATLHAHPDAELVCVGSRSPERAGEFARRHGVPAAVASYEDLVTHEDVEVVYVATTNDQHHGNALAAISAGKAVLCEKPLGLNAGQVEDMVAAAASGDVFLMEAMWMRFLPFLERVDDLIRSGAVGTVHHVAAEFGFRAASDTDRRWFNPSLGGGSLLDLGIYPLTLAYHVLGFPRSTTGRAAVASGVDVHTVVASEHPGGTFSTLVSSFSVDGANEALISGSEGRIRVHGPFHRGVGITLEKDGHAEVIDTGYPGTGFQFEVDEVHRGIAAGRIASDRHSHADSLALARWMDDIRSQVGVAFPGE